MLRAELGHSLLRSTGLNTLEVQKYALRNTYQWLYDAFDWHFLKITREESLHAGERYYTFDPDLSYENVERVWTLYGTEWKSVDFGIDERLYTQFPENQRFDPVLCWDVHENDQYEVYPVPATDGKLRMYGLRKFKPLVDESDVCLLDDLLVVMFTAARIAPKAKAAGGQLYVNIAQDRMRRLKAKARANKRQPFVLGGGVPLPPLRPGLDYMPDGR